SSHNLAAEKQFRFPIEYGALRKKINSFTSTGSVSALITNTKSNIKITSATFGKVIDLEYTDTNNFGAIMSPAAAEVIVDHLKNTKTSLKDYDLILTGDLGAVGSDLLIQLLNMDKINIAKVHNDCGKMIFDPETQDVHAGGSGCGCSASVLCSYILKQIQSGTLKEVLFIATGALMSPTSMQQGESIPAIAHLVHISNTKW
ncbi:MAG: stage V sporulation protein AD, partial [Oscillospiraceae bacterium]